MKKKDLLKTYSTALLLLFSFTYSTYGSTSLSGNIGGLVLSSGNGPYFVENDLFINNNERTVIEKGCYFYFKEFTGITVHGNLIVQGTPDEPVIFTSINDTTNRTSRKATQPHPFDWNGIHITESADTVDLSHAQIHYSTFGIKSQKETFYLTDVTFYKTGQYQCTLNDKIFPATDGIPFNYLPGFSIVYNANDATSGNAPVDNQKYNRETNFIVADNSGNLEKKGYKFQGWNTSPDGTGHDYAPGTLFKIENSNTILYAKWVKSNKNSLHSNNGNTSLLKSRVTPIICGGTGLVLGGVSLAFLKFWMDGRDEFDLNKDPGKVDALNKRGTMYSSISISTGSLSILAIAGCISLFTYQYYHNDQFSITPVISTDRAGVSVLLSMHSFENCNPKKGVR